MDRPLPSALCRLVIHPRQARRAPKEPSSLEADPYIYLQAHGACMTNKAAFSPEEWKTVLEGPPTADMIVITAAHGGMFRETAAMAQAYAEARGEHGESELLDEIAAGLP